MKLSETKVEIYVNIFGHFFAYEGYVDSEADPGQCEKENNDAISRLSAKYLSRA